jgi:hypothetical protein
MHQNERTMKKGKKTKKHKDDCQGHYIPTIINGKIEEYNTGVTQKEVNNKNGKNKTKKLNIK